MVAALDQVIRLNWQQEEMVEFIINAMRGRNRFIGCYGTAGTGKTFTAKYAVESIKRAGLAKKIGIVAPTNSACKTIAKMFDGTSNKDITTIAKALKLRPVPDANGDPQFLAPDEDLEGLTDKNGNVIVDASGKHKTTIVSEQLNLPFNEKFDNPDEYLESNYNYKESGLGIYDLLLVDEGSMVSKEHWQRLEDSLPDHAKILILMDQWQLAGVNEKSIYALELIGSNFKELTKTERYAEDSYIYKVISASLEAVKRKDKSYDIVRQSPKSVTENNQGHGYFVYDKQEGLYSFARQIDRMLQSKKWDYTRCVCWRNIEVDRINQTVRKLVVPYAEYLSVVEGELLITTGMVKRFNPLSGKYDKLLYSTATQLVVDIANQAARIDQNGKEWLVWEVIVHDPDEPYTPKSVVVIIDQYQREAYETKLQYYKDRLSEVSRRFGYKSSQWFGAYSELSEFSRLVDPIRHCYAVTGYGVQGGSYDTIYENWSDISGNKKDFDNRNRTNFVAVSRARSRINVF